MKRKGLLLLSKELGFGGATGKVPKGEDGEENGDSTFDDEEIAPDEDA